MYIISDEQLNNFLQEKLQMKYFFWLHELLPFQVMYATGCRAKESIQLQRWEILNELTVTLQPQKSNDIRIFNSADLPAAFISEISSPSGKLAELNYSKLNYRLSGVIDRYGLVIGNKDSSLHLFRHNYAKQLIISGSTNAQVKTKLGERTQKAADSYIYSVITSKKELL